MPLSQKGFSLLLLIAGVTLLLFLIITSMAPFKHRVMSRLFPKDQSQAAAPAQSGSKISWQGKDWNVTGVNMPWYNWGCDFGCNGSGGVVQTKTIIGPRLATIKGAGLHVVRWWVFPGDNPWQITVDGSGKPTGINPAVYADFDAALQLADQYDIYYNFVLFSSATAPNRSWIDNTTDRTALAQVLGVLFARYRNNPRVMSWEIFNEPEFQIWNNQIGEANTVATAKAISDSVHVNSDALVTIGNAFADGIPMWASVNLDYYSPHWYDYMNSGTYCMRCNDYNYYKDLFAITKPIVVGETYVGTNTTDDLQRFNDFYSKGYAGAWGWSLFPEKTADQLTVSLTAAQTFSATHSDIGPALNPASPSPLPSSGQASPTPPAGGSPSPLPSSGPKPGDIDGNNKVDIFDYNLLLTNFGRTGSGIQGDLDNNNKVDIFDYNLLLTNFGK